MTSKKKKNYDLLVVQLKVKTALHNVWANFVTDVSESLLRLRTDYALLFGAFHIPHIALNGKGGKEGGEKTRAASTKSVPISSKHCLLLHTQSRRDRSIWYILLRWSGLS